MRSVRVAPAGALLAALLAATLVTGCTGGGNTDVVPPPGDPSVALDTPDLVDLKAKAGIEDCPTPDPSSDPAPSKLPAVTLACLGGGPAVDLSTLRGPMVVNLWGSACGPCRTEMPVLGRFADEHGDQVAVLGVDTIDTFPAKALEQAGKRGASYPQLADQDGALLEQPEFARAARGLPYTAFVDADGTVRGEHQGAIDSVDQLADLVSTYLGVQVS